MSSEYFEWDNQGGEAPSNQESLSEQLEACVNKAIQQRLEASRSLAENSPFGPLLGYCFSNSVVLHDVLEEHQIDSQITAGARAYDLPDEEEDTDFDPDTAEELSTGIPLHYWVEVETDATTYVIELATETRPNRGPPAIHCGLPDDLIRYPDSYEYPSEVRSEVVAEARICPYCGDRPEKDEPAEKAKVCPCGREYDVDGN